MCRGAKAALAAKVPLGQRIVKSILVTKDCLIGRKQHKTINFRNNMSKNFHICAATGHARFV